MKSRRYFLASRSDIYRHIAVKLNLIRVVSQLSSALSGVAIQILRLAVLFHIKQRLKAITVPLLAKCVGRDCRSKFSSGCVTRSASCYRRTRARNAEYIEASPLLFEQDCELRDTVSLLLSRDRQLEHKMTYISAERLIKQLHYSGCGRYRSYERRPWPSMAAR
jgi:hypothetical protein